MTRRPPSMTPISPIPEDLQEKKSQAEIDVSNLQFYARMFREYKWGTDVISWTVFEQTLREVAERIAKLTAANEELERQNTRLKALIETSTWVCGKCGHGSTEHGLVGHPAANCMYEPVLITHNAASRAAIKEGQ